MKEVNKPVFICDFCDKKLFVKHAMESHEDLCYKNPKNINACMGCVHCEEVVKEYVVSGDYGDEGRRTKGFKCNKLDLKMYPSVCVTKGLVKRYPEIFEGEVQMPNTCEHWDYI